MNRRRFLKYASATTIIVGAAALGISHLVKPETLTVSKTSTVSSSSVRVTSSSISHGSTITSLTQDNLDSLLEPIRQRYKVPALTAAFVRGKDLVALGAVGTRRVGAAERVQTTDLWHLGSDTKSMTATLAAMLVEQGKLRWDSTISEIFPDLAEKIVPAYRKLTLIQLFSHRVGLPGQDKGQDVYSKMNDQLRNLRSTDRAETSGNRARALSTASLRPRFAV